MTQGQNEAGRIFFGILATLFVLVVVGILVTSGIGLVVVNNLHRDPGNNPFLGVLVGMIFAAAAWVTFVYIQMSGDVRRQGR